MLDLGDRFILWLRDGFSQSLYEDLDRYGEKVANAITARNDEEVDRYIGMIKETRGILKDMEDENLEIKDFIHLIAEKYGLKTDE